MRRTGLVGLVVELGDGGDRHPVPPQQLTHGGAGTDFGQPSILVLAQHAPILPRQNASPRLSRPQPVLDISAPRNSCPATS